MAELTDRELEQRVAEARGWRHPAKSAWWYKGDSATELLHRWHPLTNKAQAWEMLEWLRQQSSALIIDKRHVCVHLTEPPYKENVRQAWHTDLARAVCLAAVEVGRKEAE